MAVQGLSKMFSCIFRGLCIFFLLPGRREGRGWGEGQMGGRSGRNAGKKGGGTRGRCEQIGTGKLVWDAGAGSNRH